MSRIMKAPPELVDQLTALHAEYDRPETTHERRVEIGLQVRAWSGQYFPDLVCVSCKQPVVSIPDSRPRFEGHCCSPPGVVEFYQNSRLCEWCFDFAVLPASDPRREEWFGDLSA